MALITFILLAVPNPTTQVQLLVWIFVMRVAMLVSSSAAYFLNGAIAHAKYGNADEMDFETPLTSLVWITSVVSIAPDLCRDLPDDSERSATERCGGSWRRSSPAERWRAR